MVFKCLKSRLTESTIISNLDISTLSIGDWWVLYGVNCGQAPYPGGYDWYPCQHERFIR